jgi:hypothetical protein
MTTKFFSRTRGGVQTAASLAAAAMLFACVTGTAHAAGQTSSTVKTATHGSTEQLAPATLQISPQQLGIADSLQLSTLGANGTITLPAVPGITWTSVKARVVWPSQMQSGSITASGADNATTNIANSSQTVTAAADGSPQSLTLATVGAASSQSYLLNFSGNLHFRPTFAQCGTVNNMFLNGNDYDPTIEIQSVGYRITGTDHTVGSYLQGPIGQLIFRVPQGAEPQTKQAVLQLETVLISDNPDTNVNFKVVSGDTNVKPSNYFTRIVTFTGGDSSKGSTRVGDDGMTISGDGAATQREVDTLEQSSSALIQSAQSSTLKSTGVTRSFPSTMSVQQLGLSNLSGSGWGQFEVGLSFSQAAAGGEVQGATYTLRGTNSALALGTGATATLVDNGTPLQSTDLHTGSGWSLSGTIPATSIGRSLGLELQVQYFGSVGHCAELPPITVAVSPSSGFTFTHGQGQQSGFQALPQMLMPSVRVVLSQPKSFTQFTDAAMVLAGAQRMTPVTLGVSYNGSTTLPAGTGPTVVVAESGTTLGDSLTPTALTTGNVQFSHGNSVTNVSVGAKQAFLTAGSRTNGGSVLALLYPADDANIGSSLLNALGNNEQRWSNLTGDTAVLTANHQIATAQVGLTTDITTAAVAKSWLDYKWVWAFLGAALVGLILIMIRFSRRVGYSAGWITERRGSSNRRGEERRGRKGDRRRDERRESTDRRDDLPPQEDRRGGDRE